MKPVVALLASTFLVAGAYAQSNAALKPPHPRA